MIDSSNQAQADRSFDPSRFDIDTWGRSSFSLVAGVCCIAFSLSLFGPCAALAQGAEEGTLEVVVEGVVDAPIGAVKQVLLDLARFDEWFPTIDEWELIEVHEDSALVYGSQALPWPVRDRDYVVRYRWWGSGHKKFVLEARSVPDSRRPPVADRVRVDRMRTTWRLVAENDRTRVSYTYRGGTGSPLPSWIAGWGWRTHTDAVLSGLSEEVSRRGEMTTHQTRPRGKEPQ